MYLSKEIGESLTLKFAEEARRMIKEGKRIISLGIGEPDFETPKYIIDETIEALNSGNYRYSTPKGLLELREAISYKLNYENDVDVSPEDIIVTPGAKQAIVLSLMAILKPFDEVINITPSYVSYNPIVKIAEPTAIIKNIPLEKNTHKLDRKLLESAITEKTKAILINTPNNPTGKMFTKEELSILADVAILNNIYVISDEIYEKLNYSGKSHYSIASFDNMKDLVITINGFSKAYAMTGFRIGYLAAPHHLMETLNKLQLHINTNTCTFIQMGAIKAYEKKAIHLEHYNNCLKKREKILMDFIDKEPLLECVKPEGSFFAFINISRLNIESNDFCANLIKQTGVALTPGLAFGPMWNDHVRIALTQDVDVLKEGLDLISQYINNTTKFQGDN